MDDAETYSSSTYGTRKKSCLKDSKMKKQSVPAYVQQSFKVSQRVNLEDVRLVNSTCKQAPEAVGGQKKIMDVETTAKCFVGEDKKHLIVFAKFKFKGSNEDKPEDTIVSINAEFLLFYSLTSAEGIGKRGFNEFAKVNGVFNAWPYWREYVQSTIARMELPPLTLPVFRLIPADNKKKKKK